MFMVDLLALFLALLSKNMLFLRATEYGATSGLSEQYPMLSEHEKIHLPEVYGFLRTCVSLAVRYQISVMVKNEVITDYTFPLQVSS